MTFSRRVRAPAGGLIRAVLFCAILTAIFGACSPSDGRLSSDLGGEVRLIDGDPLCPDCEIVFREVATLGGDDDPGSVWERAGGGECMVAGLGNGEFLLGAVTGGGQLFVFDSEGRFSRTIGRSGRGPGEFRRMAALAVGEGDTIFAKDDGNGRLQILTADGEYIRSFRIPRPYRPFVRLGDGTFAFHGPVNQPGDPIFRQLDPMGAEIHRFRPSRIGEPDLEMGFVRPRPGRSGALWTATAWRYALEEWSDAQTFERTLIRDVEWFPPYPDFPDEVYQSVPPPTTLSGIVEDDRGRLWVNLLRPDPDWRPDIPLSPRPAWNRATFDNLIEVIDISAARVIATGKYEHKLSTMCNSHLMYALVETPLGDLRVRVVEPTIVDGAGRAWNGEPEAASER